MMPQKVGGKEVGFRVETKAQATQSMTVGLTHKLDLTLSPSTVVLVFCESVSMPSKDH